MKRQEIEQAIAALNNHRQTLGRAVVEVSQAALRHRLANLSHTDISASALRGERKHVTIMFADISGFTAISEKLDPEEVRSLINACFERLGGSIDRYGGHIDKFIGDEIMVLFGAPVAHENDPERALRAALEMTHTLEDFNREFAGQLPKPLALHFGINSGLVIAGGIGTAQRQDYSVMGDTVNLAARLEDLSDAGEILVGENTYRQTAPLFEFEALPPVTVKGKEKPVRVHRLVKAKAVRQGQVRGIEGLYSPLVGRINEMGTLRQALHNFYQGHGSVISVVGEAGIGKSRLVREIQTVCARDKAAQWYDGRALSHADSAGYLVARDVLCRMLGVGPETPSAEAASVLRAEMEQIMPNQMQEIYPYLAHLLEIPLNDAALERIRYLGGEALGQRILQSARDFIVAKTKQSPLVLVWEDLHWADPSSLRLLETLLPLTRQHPLLLVLIYRRPIKGSKIWNFHHNICANKPNSAITVKVPPLTPRESERLLENLFGYQALPPPIRNQIVTKAEGNPFYLEEVIRSLIDSNVLVRAEDGQQWLLTGPLEQISLPDTLQGIIMARIDQLAHDAKQILQMASVVGRNFSLNVLNRVWNAQAPSGPKSEDERRQQLTGLLENLETLELIRKKKPAPGPAYTFKHVFTQESVYAGLLISHRRRLHLHVGNAIENTLTGNLNETDTVLMLAYHFEQAQDRPRSLKYLQIAAEHASITYANREARALYLRALAQLDTSDYRSRWKMLSKLETIQDCLAHRSEQANILTQMQTLSEILQDDEYLSITHNRRAVYFDKVSEYRAAAEAAEVGLRVARRSGNELLQAKSLNLLALAAWRRFDYRAVQKQAEAALEALRIVSAPEVRIAGLFHLGKAGYRLGQYDLALRYTQSAQKLARSIDNRDGEAVSHMIQGWIYQRLGNYDLAEAHFQKKLRVRRAIGARYGEATALSHLGWLACDQHQPEAGLDYCRQALHISRSISDRENEAYALSGMGLNYEQLQQLDKAAECYQEALDIHTEIGAATLAIFDRSGLARIALLKNDADTARYCINIVAEWVLSGNAQKFWDPWIIYLTGYQILTALGETGTAHAILQEAHAVLHQRANEISNQELRTHFLTNVETNREIERAWQLLPVEVAL